MHCILNKKIACAAIICAVFLVAAAILFADASTVNPSPEAREIYGGSFLVGDIYLVKNDNTCLYTAPHKDAVARNDLVRGTVLSVSHSFRHGMTTWYCLETAQDTPAYIKARDCIPHEHTYVPLLSSSNGHLKFCPICGTASAKNNDRSVFCSFTRTEHMIPLGFSCDLRDFAKDSGFVDVVSDIIAEANGTSKADAVDALDTVLRGSTGGRPLACNIAEEANISSILVALFTSSHLPTAEWPHGRPVQQQSWNSYTKVTCDSRLYVVPEGDHYWSCDILQQRFPPAIPDALLPYFEGYAPTSISPSIISLYVCTSLSEALRFTPLTVCNNGRTVFELYSLGDIRILVKDSLYIEAVLESEA